jgi:hypothetical protein
MNKRLKSFLQLFNTLAWVHGLRREETKALLMIKRLTQISPYDISPELLDQLKGRKLVRESRQKIILTKKGLSFITPAS